MARMSWLWFILPSGLARIRGKCSGKAPATVNVQKLGSSAAFISQMQALNEQKKPPLSNWWAYRNLHIFPPGKITQQWIQNLPIGIFTCFQNYCPSKPPLLLPGVCSAPTPKKPSPIRSCGLKCRNHLVGCALITIPIQWVYAMEKERPPSECPHVVTQMDKHSVAEQNPTSLDKHEASFSPDCLPTELEFGLCSPSLRLITPGTCTHESLATEPEWGFCREPST